MVEGCNIPLIWEDSDGQHPRSDVFEQLPIDGNNLSLLVGKILVHSGDGSLSVKMGIFYRQRSSSSAEWDFSSLMEIALNFNDLCFFVDSDNSLLVEMISFLRQYIESMIRFSKFSFPSGLFSEFALTFLYCLHKMI